MIISRSIRTMSSFMILAFFILAGILYSQITSHIGGIFSQSIRKSQQVLTDSLAVELKNLMKQPVREMTEISALLNSIPKGAIHDYYHNYLDALLNSHPYFESLVFLDHKGHVIQSFPHDPDLDNLDMSRQFFYKQGAAEHFWSDSFLSHKSGRSAVTLSYPYRYGIIAGYLKLDVLLNLLQYNEPWLNCSVAIYDRKGVMITGKSMDSASGSTLQQYWTEVSVLTQSMSTQFTKNIDYQGRHGMATFSRDSGTGWTVMVFNPDSEIRATLNSVNSLFLILFILIGLLIIMFSGFLIFGIMQPIRVLSGITRQVTQGNYGIKNESLYSEYDELMKDLSIMIEAIRSREKILSDTEKRLHSILDNTVEGIALYNNEGRLSFINKSARDLFEISPEVQDLENHVLKWNWLSLNELPLKPEETPVAMVLTKNQAVRDFEAGMSDRYGRKHRILINAAPLLSGTGVLQGIVVTYRDITYRSIMEKTLRQSMEQYRMLFENMFDAAAVHEIILDAEGIPCDYRFLSVNAGFERQTGLRRGDILNKTVLQVLPNTERYWIENYGRVALNGSVFHDYHYSRALDQSYEVLAFQTRAGQFAVIFRQSQGDSGPSVKRDDGARRQ